MYKELFSIPIHHGDVADSHLIYDNISEEILIEDMEENIDQWGCNCKTSINAAKTKNFIWQDYFFTAISPNIEEYLEDLHPKGHLRYEHVDVWANAYDRSDYQETHAHFGENCMFSYSFNFKIPFDKQNRSRFTMTDPSRNIVTPFYDMFDKFYQHFYFNLDEASLVIFPSYVWHFVSPNRTNEKRITISGNFKVSPDY